MENYAEINHPTELIELFKNSSSSVEWGNTLLNSICEGLLIVDEYGRVSYLNSAARQIIGWDAEKSPYTTLIKLSNTKYAGQSTQLLTTSSGKTIPIRIKEVVNISKSKADNNRNLQLVLLHPVIRKDESHDPRSNFIASINHEFRTPLAALNASVEFLLDEMSHLKKTEIKELLQSIHVSVTGLQTLIDNLLESSSIEAGKFSIRCQSANLAEILNGALLVMQPLLLRRQQKIIISLPESLPQVHCDPNRIKQVIVNMLSNASKYGPINQTIRININQESKRWLQVAVIDQGPGIPAEERDHLFQKFFRIKDTDGPQFGIGLGLSVVKTIVQEHGGSVGVEEAPLGGSLFWFTVPIYGVTDEGIGCR